MLISLIIISCKEANKTPCVKNTNAVLSPNFKDTDIITQFFYNDSCYIDSLKFVLKIDKRSCKVTENTKLKSVLLDLGYIDKKQENNLFLPQANLKDIVFNNKGKHVEGVLKIQGRKIDSINYITAQTITIDSNNRCLSHLYTYRQSLSLINMNNSYLDYNSFLTTNTRFKNISKSNVKIDSVLVTVKTDEKIDDLTTYQLEINDTLKLNFKNSIKSSFKNIKSETKGVRMFNLLKMNKNFLTFKLDFSHINLHNFDKIKVSLDN